MSNAGTGDPDLKSDNLEIPPASQTPSCPDFCLPIVAKYDLNYSRRQTFVNSGPCSAFLRIMTSRSWGFGEKRYNRARSRLRCTRIPSGRSRVSREMLSDGIAPDIPGREPGGFSPGTGSIRKIFFCPHKIRPKKTRRDRSSAARDIFCL